MTNAAAPIILSFQWTEDLMRNNASLIFKGQRGRVFRALMRPRTAVAFGIIIAMGVALSPSRSDFDVFFAGLAMGLMAGFIALYLTADAQSQALHEVETDMRASRGDVIVTLDAEGAEMRQGNEVYALKWPAVTRVEEFGYGFMVFTSIFRGVSVPNAALPDGLTRVDVMARVAGWRAVS